MAITTIEPGQISKGFVVYEDGTEYEGGIFDAVPHGQGLLKNAEGHTYAGTFFYGKPQGKGVWTLPDGKTAHGEWKFGQFEVIDEYI